MRISPLVKWFLPALALLGILAALDVGPATGYASVPADVTQSPEPATPTSPPPPTDTPVPPANTTVPPTETTLPPRPSITAQLPTNTRERDTPNKGVAISLRKVASTNEPTLGGTIDFTLVVNNTGDETAQDVVVSDPLPAFLRLNGATADRGTVTIEGNTVTVAIGPVAPGDTVTIRVSATLVSAPQPPNNSNIATLTTTSSDNPEDNTGSVTIRLPRPNSDVAATALPLTETPLPNLTATFVPTLVQPTPIPPASLPPTGSPGSAASLWLLISTIGALSLALGALLRRKK